jgi:hypothetical protein
LLSASWPLVDTTGDVVRQEGRRDGNRCVQQAARVVAKVQHQALEVGVLLVDLFDLA